MRFSQRTTRLLGGACLGTVAGCHEYVPVQRGAAIPPNVTVRTTLTDLGTVAVAPVFGPHVRTLEGTLVSRADTALTMAVTQTTREDGTEQTVGGDRVVLAPTSVQDVGYVKTAVGRSVALAAVIVGGVVAAASGFGRTGSSVAGRGSGGPGAAQ